MVFLAWPRNEQPFFSLFIEPLYLYSLFLGGFSPLFFFAGGFLSRAPPSLVIYDAQARLIPPQPPPLLSLTPSAFEQSQMKVARKKNIYFASFLLPQKSFFFAVTFSL